jgi:hypothetical protein
LLLDAESDLHEKIVALKASLTAAGFERGARAFAEWADKDPRRWNHDILEMLAFWLAEGTSAPGTGLALFQDAPPDDDGGVPDPDMEDGR